MFVYKCWIFLTALYLSNGPVVYGEVIEFDKFVAPDGPWGRQPIFFSNDGGFSNILVAIHADVKESDFVLDQLKIMFRSASSLLYNTKKQYFREMLILIPDNWMTRPEYEQTRPNQTLHTARVIIRNETSIGEPPSDPFVRQVGGCGEEGEYIYLPFGRLTSDNTSTQDNDIFAEIMFSLWNILLGSEPTECISRTKENKDTEDENVRTRSICFRFLQKRNELSVVILDARENMQENDKFSRMMEKFAYYIWHLFPTYSWLGVVVATSKIETITPCVKIWEDPGFRRRFLVESIAPQVAYGSSSLGNAVIRAVEVLKEIRNDVSGSRIFVMSDGTDVNLTLNDVEKIVTSAGVVLVSLPYSANASENIALNNTINENITADSLDMLFRLEDENTFSRVYFSDMQEANDMESLFFPVNFDKHYFKNYTLVRIKCSNASALNLTGESPTPLASAEWASDDNKIMDVLIYGELLHALQLRSDVTQNVSLEVFSVLLGSMYDTDQYNAHNDLLQARSILKTSVVNFTTLVKGLPLFAVLMKNERQVINVSQVRADVVFPDKGIMKIQLTDNGLGADEVINDGSYSGYLNTFTIEGEYLFTVHISSGNNSCLAKDVIKYKSAGCYPLQAFEQYISAQKFTVIGIPPSPIADVTVAPVGNRTSMLEWTSPGKDFMTGKAARYDIRFSEHSSKLHTDFETATPVTANSIMAGTAMSPQDAMSQESMELSYSKKNGSMFYVAIRTIDNFDNVADISNVVKVVFEEIKDTIVGTTVTSSDDTSVNDTVRGVMNTPSFIGGVCVIGVVLLGGFIFQLRKYSKRRSANSVIFMRHSQSRVSPEIVITSIRCRPTDPFITIDDF